MKKLRKVISVMLAATMLMSLCAATVSADPAAVSESEVNPANLTMNSFNNGFAVKPDVFAYTVNKADSNAGNARVYKVNGVAGMDNNEAAIMSVAREQRESQPQLYLYYGGDYAVDKSFYVTANIYVGAMRNDDLLQIGGSYKNGGDNKTKNNILCLSGDGRIVYNQLAKDSLRSGGAYQNNNWYRVTMAYDATTNKTSLYLDDELIVGKSFPQVTGGYTAKDLTTSMTNMNFGVRTTTVTDCTDFTGTPLWYLMGKMNLKVGSYDSSKSDTTVTSTAYTVSDKSLYFAAKATGTEAESKISGISDTEKVSEVLSKITLPTGASAKIVKIASDSKETTVIDNEQTVSSDMKLFVTSADESYKLYDLAVNVSESNLPTITSDDTARYIIDNDTHTIKIPNTTVATLKSFVKGGEDTTVKVVDANGVAVSDNSSVTADMKLIASKNSNEVEYSFDISNDTVLLDISTNKTITNTDNEKYLTGTYSNSAWTYSTGSSTSSVKKLPGIGGSSGGTQYLPYDKDGKAVTTAAENTYFAGIIPMKTSTTVKGYKFSGTAPGWTLWTSNTGLQGNNAIRNKTVANYKIYMTDGSSAVFYPYHNSGTYMSDGVMFSDGKIKLSRGFGSSGYSSGTTFTEIGSYVNEKEYDVTVVETTPASNNTDVPLTIEAIWLDDGSGAVNLLEKPVTITDKIPTSYYRFGIASIGECYMGGINVYMTDDYNPLKSSETKEADLTLTSASVNIDSSRYVITNWANCKTVAELKESIVSGVNTELLVLDKLCENEVADTAVPAADMYVCVRDANYPKNTVYYKLAADTWGEYIFYTDSSDGKLTAERIVEISADKTDAENVMMIIATYSEDGAMISCNIDKKSLLSAGAYKFTVKTDYGSSVKDCKAFIMNYDNLMPYDTFASYTK